MAIRSVRGAITIDADGPDEVRDAVHELLTSIVEANGIAVDDVVSMLFSCTPDISSIYPGAPARDMGFVHCGIMCLQEMDVWGGLPSCIRVMLLIETDKAQKDIVHIYLRDAKQLRPDLSGEN